MANYAIGDIQGCYDSLQGLLRVINFTPEQDTLWIAGDLVNRGPKSLATLRYLKFLGSACQVVLGNHDLHMIAVAQLSQSKNTSLQKKPNPKDTFQEIINAEDSQDLINWLCQQSLVKLISIADKRFMMSHSGLPPIWSADQALSYSQEVERVLTSEKRSDFLAVMYGNTPDTWSESLQGNDRLRVITNYLTRMRFCNAKGQLELTAKGLADKNPDGFKPWFSFENPHLGNDKVIFGHWAALEGKIQYGSQSDQIFAIDTGCVWGNTLTALRLEDEKLFSCQAKELKP